MEFCKAWDWILPVIYQQNTVAFVNFHRTGIVTVPDLALHEWGIIERLHMFFKQVRSNSRFGSLSRSYNGNATQLNKVGTGNHFSLPMQVVMQRSAVREAMKAYFNGLIPIRVRLFLSRACVAPVGSQRTGTMASRRWPFSR